MDDATEDPTPAEIVIAGHHGDVSPARRGLRSPSAVTRRRALAALARNDALDIETATAATTDADPTVRRTLADLLAREALSPTHTGALLAGLLDDPDDGVVEAAAFAAGELDDPPATVVDRLVSLAGGHGDALVRESAVAGLASLGLEAGRAAIVAGCADRANVRRRAVLGLAHFEGDDVDALLDDLTGDRDLQVRQAAEDLIGIRRGEAAGAAPPERRNPDQPAKEFDSPL